ncbi:alkyl hydroperoxide reductase AhpD [Streptosporangium violaceochromogenes]|nr:alkyl hydroperoxide reductase AhpD [Streptosporangium violaceochromogenes]
MTFVAHTLETAPPAARRSIQGVLKNMGYLPEGVALLAESPETLNGFLQISAAFENATLEPSAREVVIMTVAVRNGCHLCVAVHTAKLTGLGADEELIAALRAGRSLPDTRLEALRLFTLEVITTAGAVSDEALKSFLGHGYTPRNALEVTLGVGAYTLSTLANRMVGAPVDGPLRRFA